MFEYKWWILGGMMVDRVCKNGILFVWKWFEVGGDLECLLWIVDDTLTNIEHVLISVIQNCVVQLSEWSKWKQPSGGKYNLDFQMGMGMRMGMGTGMGIKSLSNIYLLCVRFANAICECHFDIIIALRFGKREWEEKENGE